VHDSGEKLRDSGEKLMTAEKKTSCEGTGNEGEKTKLEKTSCEGTGNEGEKTKLEKTSPFICSVSIKAVVFQRYHLNFNKLERVCQELDPLHL